MPTIDIVILVLLAYGLFAGFRTGLVMQITTLVAIGAGIWGAIHFSDRVEAWLVDQVELGSLVGPVAFALTLFLILVVAHLIGRMVSKGLDLAMLSLPNKLAGALLSALKYALILSALIQIASGSGLTDTFLPEEERAESYLFHPVAALAPTLIPAVQDSPWVQRTWDGLKEELDPSAE
jgi:membrane protein required for colicin V production